MTKLAWQSVEAKFESWPSFSSFLQALTLTQFDDNTTVKSKIAATLDRSDKAANVFRAGVSLQQKVNDNVTVSVGTDVNLNTWGLGKGGDASSFGVQVAFK